MARMIAMETSCKIWPIKPFKRAIGINTTIVVAAEARILAETSSQPL